MEQSNCVISKAKCYATTKHNGQFRKFTHEQYINHPLRVAQNVLRYSDDNNLTEMIVAAILHDTVEDTDATPEEIASLFGSGVERLVNELTSKPGITKEEKPSYLATKMSKMSNCALTIKLADRLDNVSDLKNASENFRVRYQKETITIISSLMSENSRKFTKSQELLMKKISDCVIIDTVSNLAKL